MSMDIRKIKKLIEMLQESDLTEIEVTEGEEAVRISRKSSNDIVVEKPTSERKVESIVSTETKETLYLVQKLLHLQLLELSIEDRHQIKIRM